MQDIIKPIKPELVMQVDRNDIYWNMQSIFGACDGVGLVRMNIGTYMSLPNLFKTMEVN